MDRLIDKSSFDHLPELERQAEQLSSSYLNSFLIQLEVNRVSASGGGSVRLPEGTFLVSSLHDHGRFAADIVASLQRHRDRLDSEPPATHGEVVTAVDAAGRPSALLNSGVHLRSGVQLRGASRQGTALQLAAIPNRVGSVHNLGHGYTVQVMHLDRDPSTKTVGVEIRDLTLVGNLGDVHRGLYILPGESTDVPNPVDLGQAQHGHGVRVHGAFDIRFKNVRVTGCRGDGIALDGSRPGTKNRGISIDRCVFDHIGRGGVTTLYRYGAVRIRDSIFSDIVHFAIKSEHAVDAQGPLEIRGNRILGQVSAIGLRGETESTEQVGDLLHVHAAPAHQTTIENNYVEGKVYAEGVDGLTNVNNRITGFAGLEERPIVLHHGEVTTADDVAPQNAIRILGFARGVTIEGNVLSLPPVRTEWVPAHSIPAVAHFSSTEHFRGHTVRVFLDGERIKSPSPIVDLHFAENLLTAESDIPGLRLTGLEDDTADDPRSAGVDKATVRKNAIMAEPPVLIEGAHEEVALLANRLVAHSGGGVFVRAHQSPANHPRVIAMFDNTVVGGSPCCSLLDLVKCIVEGNRVFLTGDAAALAAHSAIVVGFARNTSGVSLRENQVVGTCLHCIEVTAREGQMVEIENNSLSGSVDEPIHIER